MQRFHVRRLTVGDIDHIMSLEKRVFSRQLQASRDDYLERFSLGHMILGAECQGRLVGITSSSYGDFSPYDFDGFPKTFRELSTQPMVAPFRAMLLYNFGICPEYRGLAGARHLLNATFNLASQHGCEYFFGEGMVPSYRGNEHIVSSALVRTAIDQYRDTGEFPSDTQLLRDPMLAFYHRVTGCMFHWLIPDFSPTDHASGGWRVVLYNKYENYQRWLEDRRAVTLAS